MFNEKRLTRLEWLIEEQKSQDTISFKCPFCERNGKYWASCGFEDSVYESYGRHVKAEHSPCDHKNENGTDARIFHELIGGELRRKCLRCALTEKFIKKV